MKKIIIAGGVIFLMSSCNQIIELVDAFLHTSTNPAAMELQLPEEKEDAGTLTALPQNTITVLLYKDDGVYCYQGIDIKSGKKFSYDKGNSVRDFLAKKKKEIPAKELLVLIKPDASATYKNTVDILNEMSVDAIPRYNMMGITKAEQEFIDSLK